MCSTYYLLYNIHFVYMYILLSGVHNLYYYYLAALRRHLVVKADRVRRQKREKIKLKAVFFEEFSTGRSSHQLEGVV